ncbi:MAG: glutaredoxin family protein [Eubacteriaceae bacterium]|nr:glutaredoxin family protein [Eubacteriaceae bacterium]
MYKATHVEGIDKGDIMLYALSTCGWCRKTRKLLDELGVAYNYVYTDLESDENQDIIDEEVRRLNAHGSYPTIVINGDNCIIGYDPDSIKGALDDRS